ncbi:MAG: DUF1836 domain-containing protein [Clostridia bacterium]|nr:DUF1836 domain-containing protein [Clostridia bacterium]
MKYTKEQLQDIFSRGEQALKDYHLPTWDELPTIPLYMDQVVLLLNRYLSLFSAVANDDKAVTSTMINNYVKMKLIPAPIKKKYSRVHMAYLIIVCILKQTLSISVISQMLPPDLPEEEVESTYRAFVTNQSKAFNYVTEQINTVALPILNGAETGEERLNDLVLQVAVSANIFKLLTGWITDLQTTVAESDE